VISPFQGLGGECHTKTGRCPALLIYPFQGLIPKTAYADRMGQKQVKNLIYNALNEFLKDFGVEKKT